jgi:hypothetical protein
LAIPGFPYNSRAAAARARILNVLTAELTLAAPVYAANVDDVASVTAVVDFVVLVTGPVPEPVVYCVVLKETDVHVGVAFVYDTLDAVVDGPVLVLELVALELV